MTAPANSPVLPKSGFSSVQFWLGLLAVVGTFILGQAGINVNLSFLNNLPPILKDNIVPGVIVTGLVGAFIAFSSYIETRTVRRVGTAGVKAGKPAPKGGKWFFQTSEFWLGLVTVILSYLETSGKLPFKTDVRQATDTTTLVIALVYTFARSQLKQAYIDAQISGS